MKIIIFLITLITASVLVYSIDWGESEFSFNKTSSSYDEFIGVNSVREHRLPWIRDPYRVVKNHRIFAMDAQLFTGEEIIKGKWKNHYIVDLDIPHDEYPNDKMGFNPAKGAGGFDFDTFLFEMKKNGMNSIPVLKGNLIYTNVEGDTLIHMEQLPWDDGGDRTNPMDYKSYASFLYQFTARYGKNRMIEDGGTIDPALIKVAANNSKLAGLNLVEAIEPGNEMDRDWFSKREQATPRDLAAFLSAIIDGHMGQMGPGHGIRNADPSMKILLPGLIDLRFDYLMEVKKELVEMRKDAESLGYPVNPLVDNFVINVHSYPVWKGTFRNRQGRPSIEESGIYQEAVEFVTKVRKEFPGCEIYLSEIGYDKVIAADSKTGVPTIENDPVLDKGISPFAQARQIARISLGFYGTGFDRLYLFTLKDPRAVGAGFFRTRFSTSGLIRKNGDKDLAWYVVHGLYRKLNGYHLDDYTVENNLHKMTFVKQGSPEITALWIGTNEGNEQSFKLPSGNNQRIYHLSEAGNNDWLSGKELSSPTITITEFPILIEG